MKKPMNITATTMKNLLLVVLIAIIGLSGASFYYSYGKVKSYATQVNQTVVNAHDSAAPTTSTSTKALQNLLASQSNVSATLAAFYAPANDFQTNAIQDINNYANDSGLSIGNISLGSATPAAGAATTTPALTTASTTYPVLTVNLNSPVSYTSLLKFMDYVQNSLPKLLIQGVAIQSLPGDSTHVAITSLDIEVVTQ